MAEQAKSDLEFSVEHRPGGILVHLGGKLGLPPTTDNLQREFNRICAQRPALLVVDITNLWFVSSLGLGVLSEAYSGIRRHGGSVRLCGVQEQIMQVLERTRMTSLFQVFQHADAAFAAV